MKRWLRKTWLLPFFLLVSLIDLARLTRYFRKAKRVPLRGAGHRAGISIIIPERANKELLRRCLESLRAATAALDEPSEVIVVASEADPAAYADLAGEYDARWVFRSSPLWFLDAVALGVQAATYEWVYLLNNDMVVHPLALAEVAKWRKPSVFAIASQIYFQDSSRRREETGLTEIRTTGGLVEILDVLPESLAGACRHPYAGGGSSLFQRDWLSRFIARSGGYAPFYWEDVEWGVLAWRHGLDVLFCPASMVWHAHRSTNRKFFSDDEIDRIFKRNGLRFQLRTAIPSKSLRTLFGTITRLDERSFQEMVNPSSVFQTLQARFQSTLEPEFHVPPPSNIDAMHRRPRRPELPLILIVTPYCVYPPAHGGARRIHALIEWLSRDFDIVLLSDEGDAYSTASASYFEQCHLVSLVAGRDTHTDPPNLGRIDRIRKHSRAALAARLEALVRALDPDVVQIEYIELAALVEGRDARPWLLTLHDVLLEGDNAGDAEADRFELEYIHRFDSVMVCSDEDRALLPREHVHVVHNGTNPPPSYTPSPAGGPILFLGPFRYEPNLEGIVEFLRDVYPAVRAQVGDARLWILGGVNARAVAARYSCFDQPGVSVFDFTADVNAFLEACSITINPNRAVRGSALKVIESLAAGRVCVSTEDGARGFQGSGLQALITAEDSFVASIVTLLTNVPDRHRLEVPTEAVDQFSWQRVSEKQATIYRSLSRTGSSAPASAFRQAGMRAR